MRHAGERVLGKIVDRVFLFQSKSSPDSKPYETLCYTDGSISCNCRGWVFQKKCWHLDSAQEQVRQNRTLDYISRSSATTSMPSLVKASQKFTNNKITFVDRARRMFNLED